MILTTFNFLFFAVITILIYFIIPKKLQWLFLLISSFYFLFYKSFSILNLIYVMIILITSWGAGLIIDKFKNKKIVKYVLIISVLIILGELVFLKDSNLFITTINHLCNLMGINKQFDLVYRNAPIGISYYSLIMIGYIIDVYRGVCKPQKNILKCALFMSYFPILTSGPFIRYNDMEDKLFGKHKFNYDNFCYGLTRVCWGLFKILVISQRLAIFVNTVYADYYTYNGFYIIIAAMFFVLQLYTNFSGSIDVIMGVSKIMGIDLPENFTSPFYSRTITELWRNWHITLGAWLKDYIFYPLMKSDFIQNLGKFFRKLFGKKVSKKITLYLPMLIMWILIGIWHGGAYTFIISSGILQFIFIFLEDTLAPLAKKINKKLNINTETFGYKFYQCVRTYLLFSFSMIFFRANTVGEAIGIIKNMFAWNPWILLDHTSLYTLGLDMLDFKVLMISLVVLFVVDRMQMKFDVIKKVFEQNIVFRWIVLYLLIFSIIIFGMYGPGYDAATFIYRQF